LELKQVAKNGRKITAICCSRHKIANLARNYLTCFACTLAHVCTQKMSDSEREPGSFLAERVPNATEPSRSSFSSENRTFHDPLSTRAFEALGDNLFTAAFDGTTANQIALGTEEIVAHAMTVIGEVGDGLSGFVMVAG
jgi:hypothetical protein